MSSPVTKLTNCRMIRGDRLVREDILIRSGKIIDPQELFYAEKRMPDYQVDCRNYIISPGFIDVQINGAFGKDFSNSTESLAESLSAVSRGLVKHGVTSFCPTLVSCDTKTYVRASKELENASNQISNGANILGFHLEGPFLNRDKVGAHEPNAIREILGAESLVSTYGPDLLKSCSILTLAPELDPSGDVIRFLTDMGIVVSIGHTMANLTDGMLAVGHGSRFITHLFNAMRSFQHREPNLVGLLTSSQSIYYGIICDGVHNHPIAINMAYKTHPDGLVLITDGISALGLDCDFHQIGNQTVEIKTDSNSVRSAYIKGTNILSGAVASMNECVRNLMRSTRASVCEAAKCASEHPAKLLKLYPNKGSLNIGADADLILIDDQIDVKATYVAGNLIWSSSEFNSKQAESLL